MDWLIINDFLCRIPYWSNWKESTRRSFTDADLARLSQMKGEALFWRGWAHQQLVAFFGEGYPCNGDGDKKGVPVRFTGSIDSRYAKYRT